MNKYVVRSGIVPCLLPKQNWGIYNMSLTTKLKFIHANLCVDRQGDQAGRQTGRRTGCIMEAKIEGRKRPRKAEKTKRKSQKPWRVRTLVKFA